MLRGDLSQWCDSCTAVGYCEECRDLSQLDCTEVPAAPPGGFRGGKRAQESGATFNASEIAAAQVTLAKAIVNEMRKYGALEEIAQLVVRELARTGYVLTEKTERSDKA